ncbi:MAG: hypothetical protein EHM58_14045 [Ignavibacteriae bacterium]|nr:MAG: hypothetical protein EHM58_14045 [Ignavibacteriota bacterium]
MKKILPILLLFITVNIYSQPEFKISIENLAWEKPSGSKVNLTIYIKIKNVGTEKGWCEDIYKGMYLECPDSYYNDKIEVYDYSRNITNYINPGGFVEAFLTYTVPVEADDLYFKFDESYGGATKYVSESYRKWLSRMNDSKYEMDYSEAESEFYRGNYDNAILKYKSAIEADNSKRSIVNEKLAACYEGKGDKNFEKNIYNPAIEDYKTALGFKSSAQLKEKIAKVYKVLGDDMHSKGLETDALKYYDLSLSYYELTDVRVRKNEIEPVVKKKDAEEKRLREKKLAYQKLLKPKTGFGLDGSISFINFSVSNKSKPFWGVTINSMPKLYVDEASHFTAAFNIEATISGLISTGSGNSDYNEFFKIDSIYDISKASPKLTIYNVNIGMGIGILNQKFSPMLLVNYGVYSMMQSLSLYNNETSDYKNIDDMYWGIGFKVELDFLFSRRIVAGYSFRQFSISDNEKFFDGTYTSHSVKVGWLLF